MKITRHIKRKKSTEEKKMQKLLKEIAFVDKVICRVLKKRGIGIVPLREKDIRIPMKEHKYDERGKTALGTAPCCGIPDKIKRDIKAKAKELKAQTRGEENYDILKFNKCGREFILVKFKQFIKEWGCGDWAIPILFELDRGILRSYRDVQNSNIKKVTEGQRSLNEVF